MRLGRAFLRRGVPPQYRKYDLGFLRWLAQHGKQPDYLDRDRSRGDSQAARSWRALRPGHLPRPHRIRDRGTRSTSSSAIRDLGGNLAFLSANNFFWKVAPQGTLSRAPGNGATSAVPNRALHRRAVPRERRRPDPATRSSSAPPTTVPWLFAGTGLANGAVFGQELGGYGIEIDATTPASPPGTTVLAEIPDLFGPGLHGADDVLRDAGRRAGVRSAARSTSAAQLAAGCLRMLENLWARLAAP